MERSKIDIDHLARLAALRLSADERQDALFDLERIVAMVDRMQSIDTEGVPPLAHPLDTRLRLRTDTPTEAVRREHYQEGAPAVRDGLYVVPKVIA